MKFNSKNPYFSLFFLFSLIMINGIGTTVIIPNLTIISMHYNFPAIGLIEALFVFVSTILLVFWGYLVDKIERKKLLWVANIQWLIPAFFIFIIPTSLNIYILARIGMAFGLSAFSPLAYSILADFAKYNDRGLIASGLNLSWVGSSAIGILIGSIFSERWYLSFGFISFLGLIILFWQVFINVPLRGRQEPAFSQILNYHYKWKIQLRLLPSMLKSKTLIWLLLQGIFALIPGTFFTYYLISFLNSAEGFNISIRSASVIAIIIASGRTIGYPFFGKIGDIYGTRGKTINRAKIATICMAGQALFFFVAFIAIDSNLVSYILFSMFFWLGSFTGGGSGPNRTSLLYSVSLPEYRGTLGALFSITDQIGITLGVFISTILLQNLEFRLVFLGGLIFYLFAAIAWSFSLPFINTEELNINTIKNARAKEILAFNQINDST